MPDIFDEIDETQTKPAGDVFDELLPELPEPKPWELSPTGQKPYLGQFSGGPGAPYEELNREEAMNIFKSLAEPPISAPRFEGESTLGKVAAGVGNVAGGIYNMLASPVGALTLPFAATKIGAPIAKGVFGGLAAKTAGEQLGEASVTGDVQQYTEGLLNAIMAPGIALPGRFGYVEPENIRMAKDLAREIERAEPTFEPKTPEAMRQLGIRVPDFSPFADPEVARLADAALQERMRMVQIPGQEQNALMDLRRAIEPPRLEIAQPVARAERIEGGGQAPYGKVSFMREAEAPLPERTQAATRAEPAPKPAEPVAVTPKFKVTEEQRARLKGVGLTDAEISELESGVSVPDIVARKLRPFDVEYGGGPDHAKALEEARFQAVSDIESALAAPKPVPVPETAKPALTPKQEALQPTAPPPEPAKVAEVKPESVPPAEQPTPPPAVSPTEPTKGIITGRAIEKWADDTLRGGATHLGPDVLAAYLVKGAALIERGIINFAEWSARMIAEHGDKVKPHLRELFTAAQETARRAPITETGTLKSAREIVEQRIAQSQVQPTVTTTAPSVAATSPAPAPAPSAAPTTTPTTPTTQAVARPQVTLDDIYRIFEPAPKKPTPIKTRGVNLIESIRTGFSSKFRPINQLAEDIAKAYGGARKDIAGIFEQLKGSSGKGEADIYRFNGDVSSLVKGQEKDFNAYMFLNRSLDRLRQDLKDIQTAMAGGNVPRLNRRSVAQYTIPQLEAKLAVLEQKLGPERLATFQKAASEYQRYMDDALRLQVESGRMSQDVYDAIKSGNQFYAPFKVMKYLEESMKPEGTGRKIDTVADYTKAMEGIEDPDFRLGDMLGAARQSLLISRILADKAIAMRNIADLSKIDTQRLFIKRLNKGEDIPLGMQAVNVFENGRKVRYATRPEVAQALDIYGDTGGGVISGILRGFSVPFKLGATALNVPFQISNLMADVPRQALVSKYGIRGVNDLVRYPLDLVHAIYSSMTGDILRRDNKLFLDFLDSGAAATTVQEHLTPKALQYRDPSTMSKSKRIALNILYSPAEFSTAIEQVSKILGVKRAMRFEGVKSGAELAKQVPEAITEIRRFSGSPDFGRQGKFVEQARLNLLYMFLNARIQGAVADLGRLTGRDGAKQAAITWFRIGSAVGLPTAYLYALNNSPEFKADYDQRPQQEKDNYWLIPKDSFITNEQGERIRDYWRIPKRESSKWISNMTESALNFAEKRDAKTFANFSQKMIEDISPVNIQGNTAQERLESVAASLNPVIKAPLELATGRDMYRHRDLLGETLRRASPEQQYTDRTATAFKVLADKIPDIAPDVLRSPVMLENITRNMTAGLLTQFLSKKPVEGRGKIENAALLQRFQAVPYTDNAEFTKQMKELERESADDYLRRHRSAQKLIEDNKGKTLSELIGKSSQDPKVMKQVVDLWIAKENGATSQDRRLIALPAKQRAQYIARMLKPMSPAEKERAILDLSRKRVLTETVFQEMSQLPQ